VRELAGSQAWSSPRAEEQPGARAHWCCPTSSSLVGQPLLPAAWAVELAGAVEHRGHGGTRGVRGGLGMAATRRHNV
jgi:hypothetical protein